MSPTKMGGRQPSLTEEQALELLRLRRQIADMPTPEDIAARWNKPLKLIRRYLFGDTDRLPKRHEHLVHADLD